MPASRKTEKAPARGRTVRPTSLLAVDVGNSETVVGRFRGRELVAFWRLTSGRLTADEARSARRADARRGLASSEKAGAVLCSVAPSLTMAWPRRWRRGPVLRRSR
jgi:pantothenate kinase type III